MKKLSGDSYEKKPTNWYYQFKKPDPGAKSAEKVRVLEKGQTITGTFQHTFVSEDKMFTNHLIETETEGNVTIKGCTGLNKALAQLSRGDKVKIVYLGKGKPKAGKRPPFLFDVYGEPSNTKVVAPETDLADAEEEVEPSDDATF